MANDNWMKWGLAIVAILLLFPGLPKQLGLNFNLGGQAAAPANGGTPPSSGGLNIDHITEDTTVTLSCVDRFKTTNITTNEYVRVFLNGFDKGQKTCDGGTVDATPNQEVKFLFGENSTLYYTDKEIKKIPDAGQVQYEGQLALMDDSPTRTFFNEFDQPDTSQTIGASQIKDIAVQIRAQSKHAFGNPESTKKNLVCFNWNTTPYVKVSIPSGVLGPIPTEISNRYSVAGFKTACYEIDAVMDSSAAKVNVRVESNNDPAGNDAINISYVDTDFDLNADDSSEIWDYEDEDNNNLGMTTAITDTITVA